jgi:hypothetical protein
MTMPRAVYRSNADCAPGRPVRRLHLLPDTPQPDPRAMCGQPMRAVTHSRPVILDPMPATPPPGLTWCAPCIGRLAEHLGTLGAIAAELAKGIPCPPSAT